MDRLVRSSAEANSRLDKREAPRWVVRRALALLVDIHKSLISEADAQTRSRNGALGNSSAHRIVDALLDLVVLEGIYPLLEVGVGVPIERRVGGVLKDGVGIRGSSTTSLPGTNGDGSVELVNHEESGELLDGIVQPLDDIASTHGRGLNSALRDRGIVDLMAAEAQLAYSPSLNRRNGELEERFQNLVEKYFGFCALKHIIFTISDCDIELQPSICYRL